MNGFPLQAILLPILGLVLVVFMLRRQKQMIAAGDQQYASFRLDRIAPRMQLAIVEGGPDFNLMMAHAHHGQKDYDPKGGMLGKLSGDGMKESRAILRGTPNGRPTELFYYSRTDIDRTVMGRTQTQRFECRLSMHVGRPFAPFEIVLRQPAAGMESPATMGLPPASSGDPLLDSKLALFAADPRVGPAIAAAMAPLASVNFLHIRAADQSIGHHATMMGSSVALFSIEQVQYALDQMASVLDGGMSAARPAAMAS